MHGAEVSAGLSLLLGGPFLGLTQFRTLEGARGAEIPLPAVHRFAFIKEELFICCAVAHPFGLLSSWATSKSSKTIGPPSPSTKDEICPQNFQIFLSHDVLHLNISVNPPRLHVAMLILG